MILGNTIFIYILLKTISRTEYENSKTRTYIIVNWLAIGISYNVLIGKFKYIAILAIATYIVTSIFILKNSIYHSFVGVSLFYVLFGIAEILCCYLLIYRMGFTKEYVRDTLLLNFFVQMIGYSIVLFLIIILKIVFKKDKVNNTEFNLKKQNIFFIITVLTLIMINFIYWGYNRENDKFLILMNVIFMATFLFISLIYIFISQDLMYRNKENEELRDYIDTIRELSKELRVFKHNYLNLLYSIGGYIECEEWDELKDYYNKVVLESEDIIHSDNFFAIQKIKNKALFGLLNSKLKSAKSQDINMDIIILNLIDDIGMENFDICQVLGIFIDNAIEESKKSRNKDVIIEIYDENDITEFTIKNSYKTEPKLDKIYEKGYTTKNGENSGIGLCIAKDILDKYDNVLFNTYIKDDLFVQQIVVKKVS